MGEPFQDISCKFSVEVINTCRKIKEGYEFKALISLLLRSGTSIGANIHEANYASSKS